MNDDGGDDDDDTLIVIGRRQTDIDIMTYSLASSFALALLAPPLRFPLSKMISAILNFMFCV